ncbi:MAG: hypothetical protein HC848_09770 [Limnobacter sp.]|nr:hypothetical protein [Limnobacter sp.]
MVLNAITNDISRAGRVLKFLDKSKEKLPEGSSKIEKVKRYAENVTLKIEKFSNGNFRFDLIKAYPVPQKSDWKKIFEGDQVQYISMPQLLSSEQGDAVYEIKIQATPFFCKKNPDGSPATPSPVWLHIHLDAPIKPGRNEKLTDRLFSPAMRFSACHLKSDFFRPLGSKWETELQREGYYGAVVERTKVDRPFIELLHKAFQKKTPVQKAGKLRIKMLQDT